MLERTVNLDKLGALSNEELRHLAVWLGIDMSGNLERSSLIDELTEAILEDSEEYHETMGGSVGVEEKKFNHAELVIFPGKANCGDNLPEFSPQTRLKLFSRDPVWAYASWDFSENDRNRFIAQGIHSFVLRMSILACQSDGKMVPSSGFDIPVSIDDTEWYLNIPEAGVSYIAELCSGSLDKRTVIVRSNVITAPRNSVPDFETLPPETQALLELSGLNQFLAREEAHENPQRILEAGGT